MNNDLKIPLPESDPPDASLINKIASQLAQSSSVIRPLPSNGVLLAIGLGIFAVVSFALAAIVGFKAFASLSAVEMAAYYGTVAVFAILFARAVIERMIPGERHFIQSSILSTAAFVVLGVLMALLFSSYETTRFVATGIPCIRLGVISALVSGLLGWRFFQKGYFVKPRETVLLYGLFAGFLGIAVLALHCPVRNSLHFIVWHLGAMVLAGLAGLFLGRFLEIKTDAD